jgi:hypothetical protein
VTSRWPHESKLMVGFRNYLQSELSQDYFQCEMILIMPLPANCDSPSIMRRPQSGSHHRLWSDHHSAMTGSEKGCRLANGWTGSCLEI